MNPRLRDILSEDECRDLCDAALSILNQIGVRVTHPEAMQALTTVGAAQGSDGRVRLPATLISSLVHRASRGFRMHDRAGGFIETGKGRTWMECGGMVSHLAEWPDGALRPARRSDVAQFARLCDALPLVHVVVPAVEAQDVEPARAEIITLLETLLNTSKFILACPTTYRSARAWADMGRIASGSNDLSSKPSIGLLVTMLPALRLDDECAATAILAAREGMPMVSMAGAVAGATCPNTVAGSVAVKLAGELFMVALGQIIRPGTPALVDTGAMVLDMNTTDISLAGPEELLGIAAMAQAARRFGLPSYSCALHCEAKTGDFQAGMEKMAGLMVSMLAGVDLSTNLGMLSRCNAASYEQLLVDHELCSYLERFQRGLEVSVDTLALEVLSEVGMGGDFLTHEHTVRHCRSGEIWHPSLLDRTAVGTKPPDLYEKAHRLVQDILSRHQSRVSAKVHRELERFIQEFPW